MIQIKLKPLLALMATMLVLAGVVVLAHRIQVGRTARSLYARADSEVAAGRPAEAVETLAKYLALRPDDDAAMVRLAWLLDRSTGSAAERARVVTAFDRALRRRPGRVDLRRRLAELQAEQGHFAEARSNLKTLLRGSPNDPALEEWMGQIAEAERDFPSASHWYDRALTHDSKRASAAVRLAELKRRRFDDPEGGDRVMDALVRADPRSIAARLDRARYRLATALGDLDHGLPTDRRHWEKVDRLLGEILRDDDDPEMIAWVRRTKAIRLAATGSQRERRDAAALLEGLERKTREDHWMLVALRESVGDWNDVRSQALTLGASKSLSPAEIGRLADLLLRHAEIAAAAPLIGRLAAFEPDRFTTVDLESRLLHARGNARAAAERLKRHAKRHVKDTGAVAERLEALALADEAEPYYRAAAVRHDDPGGRLALAGFLARQERIEEALDVCKQAWETCRAEDVAQATLAVIDASEAALKSLDLAACRLESASDRNPASAPVVTALASIRELQGRFHEAERLYRRVLTLDARDVVALNNLALLIALRDAADGEPLDLIDRAINEAGARRELLDTRGVVRLVAGDTAGALSDLSEATGGLDSGPFYFHLAQAHLKAGDRQAAAVAFRKSQPTGRGLHSLERTTYHQLVADLGPAHQ